MRIGSNALDVNDAVKAEIARAAPARGRPPRADLRPLGAHPRLRRHAEKDAHPGGRHRRAHLPPVPVHLRSALVAIVVIPLAVLIMAFIPCVLPGLTINIMSLGGIAIAWASSRTRPRPSSRTRAPARSHATRRRTGTRHPRRAQGGRTSDLLLAAARSPSASCRSSPDRPGGAAVSARSPHHTFATFAAAMLSITLVPPLMLLLMRGRFRTEAQNPVSRLLTRMYRPIVRLGRARARWVVCSPRRCCRGHRPGGAAPGIGVHAAARRGLAARHADDLPRHLDRGGAPGAHGPAPHHPSFPEVASVHGKAGRAETATDPAQLDMIESVVTLRPRDAWPRTCRRGGTASFAPDWLKVPLRWLWPEQRPRTLEELAATWTRRCRCPATRWRSRRRSARASTC
jgi:Cu(I)/Ag(I) efflux system membrane protein CusA/SilA